MNAIFNRNIIDPTQLENILGKNTDLLYVIFDGDDKVSNKEEFFQNWVTDTMDNIIFPNAPRIIIMKKI